jgi:GT2 family glycosyltransferase
LQGSALAFTHRTLARIGPLYEGYFYAFEETEWCLRARRLGLENWVVGESRVVHHGTASLGGPDGYNQVVEYMLMRNMLVFLQRYGYGERCVESHIEFWLTNSHRTTFRAHDVSPPDPDLAAHVIESAVAAFRAGRPGPWLSDLTVLRPGS